jgi:hypothetical protein
MYMKFQDFDWEDLVITPDRPPACEAREGLEDSMNGVSEHDVRLWQFWKDLYLIIPCDKLQW